MRQLAVVGMMMVSSLAFSQQQAVIDPSYSVNNYKQPNKAAYAREHNLDRPVQLQTALVTDNADYKHLGRAAVTVGKPVVSTVKEDKTRKSEKHPLGF